MNSHDLGLQVLFKGNGLVFFLHVFLMINKSHEKIQNNKSI